ncbi:MAG TPA: TlpA disulfide reductase family protein [Burkholderiales bacterium]|nr:TlpA disulfide reductase family protein [Burkholderiales bacterium]
MTALARRLAVLLALAGPALGSNAALAALPKVGAAAPDFAAKSNSGRNVRLSELRGQVVLVNFWATWCSPCRQELPLLNKIYAQYRSAGFMLLAVNVDDNRRDAEAMLKRLDLRFPTLFDGNKSVAKLYGVDTMPATLVIDRDGRVRFLHRGYYDGYERKYEQQVRELLKE